MVAFSYKVRLTNNHTLICIAQLFRLQSLVFHYSHSLWQSSLKFGSGKGSSTSSYYGAKWTGLTLGNEQSWGPQQPIESRLSSFKCWVNVFCLPFCGMSRPFCLPFFVTTHQGPSCSHKTVLVHSAYVVETRHSAYFVDKTVCLLVHSCMPALINCFCFSLFCPVTLL